MSYDLMNRRDTETNHHSSISGSLNSIDIYLERGFAPKKLNLGFAFYAKFFTTAEGVQCDGPIGCKTAVLEAPDGSDTGISGAVTFEKASFNDPEFVSVLGKGKVDEQNGGAWYWDPETNKFWTWDTPELVARKFEEIVKEKGLGGVFAWSLAQDSQDWSRFKAMQEGVQGME